MYVYGITVTEAQQAACVDAMRGRFHASDITTAAMAAGCPEFCQVSRLRKDNFALRVAERLLQRERKAGNITREGKVWVSNIHFDQKKRTPSSLRQQIQRAQKEMATWPLSKVKSVRLEGSR